MSTHRFPKRERLVSDKLEDALFTSKDSHASAAFPIRAVWMLIPITAHTSIPPVQLLISAPKKRLRHAVDRNRAKRQMREAWRLHSDSLRKSIPSGHQLVIALIWIAPTPRPTTEVFTRVIILLERIIRALSGPVSCGTAAEKASAQ